jgi:hypothetical protein
MPSWGDSRTLVSRRISGPSLLISRTERPRSGSNHGEAGFRCLDLSAVAQTLRAPRRSFSGAASGACGISTVAGTESGGGKRA